MPNRYNQGKVANSATHFTASPMSGIEFSRMTAMPTHTTCFNAGDIIPIYCQEVLPHDTFDISLDAVIRQNTVLTPTMANMDVDFYAFFVPNRVVNESWKNVNGENSSGTWITPKVNLIPLYPIDKADAVQIPVGSVADYYGLPTQAPIPAHVLASMNDLRFRGYLSIYNEYFRDQNYQAPIPFSKLNIYEGFLEEIGTTIGITDEVNTSNPRRITGNASGSAGRGAIVQAIYGAGANLDQNSRIELYNRVSAWSALSAPLKANKKHDYFTSVLPSPQKGDSVTFALADFAPIKNDSQNGTFLSPYIYDSSENIVQGKLLVAGAAGNLNATSGTIGSLNAVGVKLVADLSNASNITVAELRQGAAIQQTYELLARGGSRYREFVKSFFGIETDDPFSDIPKYLGHVRRQLDLYQTAQTSPSESGSTPQGNLAAFGYTSTGGHLFHETFLEHGHVHILAVVRHQNVYPSSIDRSWFRLNQLDFYLPTLANISEQPVYTREINPFASDPSAVWGYNEAWAEYRMECSRVSAQMRTGIGSDSLALWNYADEFNSALEIADGNWLKSNSAEVLDRSLAVSSEVAPQFKALFTFSVTKQRPMPTYSVPALDVI